MNKNLTVYCDGNRTWRHEHGKKNHNKRVLVSWIQLRCQRCQRFLTKKQIKWCGKCRSKLSIERTAIWNKNHKDKVNATVRHWRETHKDRHLTTQKRDYYRHQEERKLKQRIYNNADRYEVGQIV